MKKHMKKIIATLSITFALTCTGCSMGNQTFTADFYFNKAIIRLTDEDNTVITVNVKSYSAGDSSVIIETDDGRKYGVAYQNVTFFNE